MIYKITQGIMCALLTNVNMQLNNEHLFYGTYATVKSRSERQLILCALTVERDRIPHRREVSEC